MYSSLGSWLAGKGRLEEAFNWRFLDTNALSDGTHIVNGQGHVQRFVESRESLQPPSSSSCCCAVPCWAVLYRAVPCCAVQDALSEMLPGARLDREWMVYPANTGGNGMPRMDVMIKHPKLPQGYFRCVCVTMWLWLTSSGTGMFASGLVPRRWCQGSCPV